MESLYKYNKLSIQIILSFKSFIYGCRSGKPDFQSLNMNNVKYNATPNLVIFYSSHIRDYCYFAYHEYGYFQKRLPYKDKAWRLIIVGN